MREWLEHFRIKLFISRMGEVVRTFLTGAIREEGAKDSRIVDSGSPDVAGPE